MSRIGCWILAGLAVAALLAAVEAPRAQDAREYELVQQALAERSPAKRLKTLEAWSSGYKETALAKVRAQLYLQTYREAGKTAEAIEAAERLLEVAPGDFAARYALVSLAPVLGSIEDAALARAETAAEALLDGGIEAQFDADKRPENVPAQSWEKARVESHAGSLRTLGWIAMQRKQHTKAEARLTEALEVEPASAQTSYWLAQSILAQRDPNKNEAAFFSLARAATLEGEGALPAESRAQIRAYLYKVYEGFAGTADGLDTFERLAAASALPPAGLPQVLSAEERGILERERFCKENPAVCAYLDLRDALVGVGGASVWAELKGKLTPKLKLYVVANEPADRPLALRLSSEKGGEAEVVLKLQNRLREAIPVGRAVAFEGVAERLVRSPFLLTLGQGRVL